MNYELIRDGQVEVIPNINADGYRVATIIVDDKFEHEFSAQSRVSKSLDIMTPEDLGTRLSGGNFFFVGDELYDFRDGQYQGFVHTDDSIDHLADIIGISDVPRNGVRVYENTTARHVTLGSVWSNHGIAVPGFQDGGEFQSELHFGWSPFVKTVNSAFMLTRLICSNGMRGLRSFMNTKIPLINRWEEHLDMANRQIQNKVDGMVTRRFAQMGTERATVAETNLLAQHAKVRLVDGNADNAQARQTLTNIVNIASPHRHLSGVYRENVFNDSDLAAQHPAHLTTFDVYNMATEMRSHTTEVDGSTARALDRLSNDLVFDRPDLTQHASRYTQPKLCSFSDPDAAFFGNMH